MASKRTIKRKINFVCEELFAECVATSLYGTNASQENVESLLHSIATLGNNYISRVSHVEPGMTAKAYFKDLNEKFSASVNEIIDQINNLN